MHIDSLIAKYAKIFDSQVRKRENPVVHEFYLILGTRLFVCQDWPSCLVLYPG